MRVTLRVDPTDGAYRPSPTAPTFPQTPTHGGGAPDGRRRILMLSWEYPPVLVGGLGRHVHHLSTSLAAAGHEVTVVTRHSPGAPLEEYAEGVRIVRAPEDPPVFPLATPSLLAWTMAFNHTLTRAALRAAESGEYDVIHAHDWLVTHTAITLKEHLDLPLVATIHATEAGRHQGWLPDEMNKAIHSVEWWLGQEAARVVVCSEYMKWEVNRLFDLPAERLDVVANGVETDRWQVPADAVANARRRFAGDGPLLTFAGRLVYEKGVQDLIASLPKLRDRHPGLRLVIAGDGPYKSALEADIHRLGLSQTVTFPGFLGGTDLPAVIAASDCFAVPSIYEPFGMVALEGAAAGAPLAVASTGGLAEFVTPGFNGTTFPAKDPDALADAIGTLLADAEQARTMAKRARAMVHERYGWASIAARTAAVYSAAIAQAPAFNAAQAEARMAQGRPSISIREGNLLAVA
jgi:glycogen(starch) synthase